MRQLEEVCREKDGLNAIIKNELVAQKRNTEKFENRAIEAEKPLPGLREAANKQMHRANKHKTAAVEWKLKATSLESQIEPLKNQILLLQSEVEGLKELNTELTNSLDKVRV